MIPNAQADKTNQDEGLRHAISVLERAEAQLRTAAAKSAESGSYDHLALITQWAKLLHKLTTEVHIGFVEKPDPQLRPIPLAPLPQIAVDSGPNLGLKRRGRKVAPSFRRDSGFLVKRATARKSRQEYEHRAPYEVVVGVAGCLADWRSSKKLLTAEQLIATYASRKGSVVSYQVYVVLGWLVQIGLVRRHRRSGYSVPAPTTIVEKTLQAWEQIAAG